MKQIFSLLLLSLFTASCSQQTETDLKTETLAAKEKTCGCSDDKSPYAMSETSSTANAGCGKREDILTVNLSDSMVCNTSKNKN